MRTQLISRFTQISTENNTLLIIDRENRLLYTHLFVAYIITFWHRILLKCRISIPGTKLLIDEGFTQNSLET